MRLSGALIRIKNEHMRTAGGDPEALVGLMEEHRHRLFGYLLRIAGDRAAAEDLFQQTWLRVMEQIGRYDGRRRFEAWLFAIAHNLAIDYLRRKRPESLEESGADPPDRGASALEASIAGERRAMVGAAMAKLPAVYRETVALRFEQDLKLEEIAAVLNTPLSTVKSRLRRGLEALRAELTT